MDYSGLFREDCYGKVQSSDLGRNWRFSVVENLDVNAEKRKRGNRRLLGYLMGNSVCWYWLVCEMVICVKLLYVSLW